ncbi:MAG: hypothetical protein COA32_08420 [Fluviicola sp.]|nr:MAG: hypothetical protein COA32_08420 [Fluviicola sp.]
MKWFDKQAADFEISRFGAMTLMITFQSCLGSVAAMYALENGNTFILATVAVVTMASNAMFIAQAEAKHCLFTFYLSVIVNLIILIILYFL